MKCLFQLCVSSIIPQENCFHRLLQFQPHFESLQVHLMCYLKNNIKKNNSHLFQQMHQIIIRAVSCSSIVSILLQLHPNDFLISPFCLPINESSFTSPGSVIFFPLNLVQQFRETIHIIILMFVTMKYSD